MATDMLTIYLHYEVTNQEAKMLQRSMMRRDVLYYDLILMIEEVGFQAINFLYYAKKPCLGSSYLVHIYDQGLVLKMLSDPEIVKAVHLYVSKEKVDDHIAPPSKQIHIGPSNHPNESVLLQHGGVSAEGAGKLTMGMPQSIPLEPCLLHICIYCCNYWNKRCMVVLQDHDVNQLQIQQNSSSSQDHVIDSVPEVRETRDLTGESVSRTNQQGTRTEHPHPARSKRKRTSSIKAASKVVLKTSTYPNKRNVAYGTIRSTNPRTKVGGIELGAEFALVRIDQPILDNEELVREVSNCKTIGEAFNSGYLIAWPSAFIREKDS
ncbi:unnamed protein product [Triticum turgidum subsp. durum]|uniref:Transposase Tnp1/En/Spm-like domain-containing protein n=1 Tax=Triticum turgidum subsp. durum TaxID=4567 RepID=A0A9R0TNQ3_TRITD|nr:unnamed protein product [Triticum turgidum subsp. durum]